MSRKRTEIQPKRAENLKYMIEDLGITQGEFGKIVGITQQGISKLINLKSALTEELAKDIIKKFPQYRLQWLLGYDDFPTASNLFNHAVTKADDEGELLNTILAAFTQLYDYKMEYSEIYSGMDIGEAIRAIHQDFCTISKDGKKKTFSLAEFRDFQQEICDYIEMRLSHIMQ